MIVSTTREDPRAARLLAELAATYVQAYGAHDLDQDDPTEYAPPAGGCLLGLEAGTAVAVGCWRRLDDTTCELGRVYVIPAARNRGWRQRMAGALVEAAAASGYERALWSTTAGHGVVQGAREVQPYASVIDLPGVRCYELHLGEHGEGRRGRVLQVEGAR